jgi:hypothetical protein
MSLLETVSGLAVRYLPQERLTALRERYLAARTKLYPVMRAVYGTFDVATLRAHLEQRIGTDFEILMVHSSVNNMKADVYGQSRWSWSKCLYPIAVRIGLWSCRPFTSAIPRSAAPMRPSSNDHDSI